MRCYFRVSDIAFCSRSILSRAVPFTFFRIISFEHVTKITKMLKKKKKKIRKMSILLVDATMKQAIRDRSRSKYAFASQRMRCRLDNKAYSLD